MQTLYSRQILVRRKPRAKTNRASPLRRRNDLSHRELNSARMLLHFLLSSLDLEPPSYFASRVAQLVKNLPATRETWIQSLGWEDPLGEGMATHSSILAWRIPMDRGTWWATIHGVAKSRIQLSD